MSISRRLYRPLRIALASIGLAWITITASGCTDSGSQPRTERPEVASSDARAFPAFTDVTSELFDKVINVNLRGPFRLCALFGERMAAEDGGSIINVSSTSAVRTNPGETPYGAAKAGVNAMTRAFAHAYAPKVRVNTIMPGPFGTDIADAWTDEVKESLRVVAEPMRG